MLPEHETDTATLERRNRELSILNAIAQALNREVDLQRTLDTALAQVAQLLGLQTGWIWLLNEDTGEPYLAAAQHLPPGLAEDPRRMQGPCYCLDTYRAGDLNGAANVNVITCSRLRSLVGGTGGLRYHASIPLYAQDRKLGVLNVASADWRGLAPDDLRLLYTVGDLVSIAVQRARLFARSAHFGAVEERNRLAREIHDTLAQGLAGIVLQLETADALLEAGTRPGSTGAGPARPRSTEAGSTGAGSGGAGPVPAERARGAVQQALELARANLEEARRSVHDLRAAPLEGRTLKEALGQMASEWTRRSGVEVSFTTAGEDRPLPLRVEAALYRVAQEALSNVARHGGARHVWMELEINPARVRLSIEDNGRGFDTARIPKGRYGLLGLQERARLLGGSLELRSGPGAGTRVAVAIPLGAI